MAGNLRPDNVKDEALYTVISGKGLFDQITTDASAGTHVDFRTANQYVELQINEACRIWRHSLLYGPYASYGADVVKIFKFINNEYIDISVNYSPEFSSTDWTVLYEYLSPGKYKFISTGGNRIDGEWYIEKNTVCLIKSNNQYYSIKPEYYNNELQQYNPLEIINFDGDGFTVNDLFTEIKIGDTTTDVTPVMTSNTTPSPYVVSASSTYDQTNNAPWKSFNNKLSGIGWCTSNGVKTGWIKIDLAIETKINRLHIYCNSGGAAELNVFPSSFILWGSNDDISYDNIKQFNSIIPVAGLNEFILDNDVIYRYYKLEILSNNGGTYSGFPELRLLYYEPLKAQFTPIDKFDNFQLVTKRISNNFVVRAIKSTKELIIANDDIPLSIAENVDFFKLTTILKDNGIIKLAISIDKGLTWKTFNGSDFVDLTCTIPLKAYNDLTIEELNLWNTAKDEIFNNGITLELFDAINFNLLESTTIRFAYVLNRPMPTDTAETTQLEWQFDALGSFQRMNDNECIVQAYKDQIKIKSLIDNSIIKVNLIV